MTRAPAFASWLASLDPNQLDALRGRTSWVIVLTVTLVGTLLGALVPPVSNLMEIQLVPTLALWTVMFVMAALISSDLVSRTLSQAGFGVLMLATSAALQLFFWGWVCFSSEYGAVMLVAFAMLTAAYHGEFFQTTASEPWGFLPAAAAILGALVMAPDTHHLSVVIGAGVIALGAVYAMGNIGRTRNRTVRERDSLRAAVDAQVLADRGLEVERSRSAVNELRGRNHDAANALGAMLGSVDLIGHYLDSVDTSPQMASQLRASATSLKTALDRLSAIVLESSQIGHAAIGEPINVAEVLHDVINEQRHLFPHVEIDVDDNLVAGPADGDRSLVAQTGSLSMPGGATTLARIITNLLCNACEGNGERSASRVRIGVAQDANWVSFQVSDDGPGFRADQLIPVEAPISTTKSSGSGLGLYTTRRLVLGSHGTLTLANEEQGGAIVVVRLPVGTR